MSATGPKMTTGRGKPGCRRLTLSYAGNLDIDSDQTRSSQWSCTTEIPQSREETNILSLTIKSSVSSRKDAHHNCMKSEV